MDCAYLNVAGMLEERLNRKSKTPEKLVFNKEKIT
jgi:hypothetical protein